jgi:hypothetical protein
MRIGLLLFALLITVIPTMARGSRGGSSHSHTRSYGSHSPRSHSSHPRSYASSYRSHSSNSHAYRSTLPRSNRSRGTSSYRTRQIPSNGSVQRDSHGKIKRSAAAKGNFKRQQPCPSTGKSRGACPGYVIDHVKPLECGGADAPSNMQWQTKAEGKAKDKTERYCR